MPLTVGGKKISSWWLIGGLAGAGVVIYAYRKSASGSAAGSGSGIDPLTGLPASMDNQMDPATGLTYLQEAQQYGSVAAAEAAVSGGYSAAGGYAGYQGTAGYPTYYPPSQQPPGGQPGAYVNFAQWAQAATAGLVSLGFSATDVAAALGLYQAGMPLGTLADGASALSIVQAAVAEFGTPPGGPYPIVAPPSNNQPPPNQQPPRTLPPPRRLATNVPGAVKGLRVAALTATVAVLTWEPTPGATSYEAKIASPAGYPLHKVISPTITFSGLKPKTSYTAYVTAEPASSGHAAVTFKTS